MRVDDDCPNETVLEDPGMERVDVPFIGDFHHGLMSDNSQILNYVESMNLMEGHPFRDVTDLLRKIPLSCNASSLETMDWIQNQVIVSSFSCFPV